MAGATEALDTVEAGDVDLLSALRACMAAYVAGGPCRRLAVVAALGDECVPWHYSHSLLTALDRRRQRFGLKVETGL